MSLESIAKQLGLSPDQLQAWASKNIGNWQQMVGQDQLDQDQFTGINRSVQAAKAHGDPALGGDGSVPTEQQTPEQQQNIATNSTSTGAGGLAGVLGGKDSDYQIFEPRPISDSHYDENRARLAGAITDTQNLQSPTMQGVTVAPAAQVNAAQATGATAAAAAPASAAALPADMRTGQVRLAGQLAAQANGQGPTLAEQRMKETTDRGMAQQLAMAASARGVNPAQAMRSAADGQAQVQAQGAQQEADLTQQEQMTARGQLAGVLSGVAGQDLSGRSQDIGLSQFNNGQAQQNNQFNATQQQQNSQFNTTATNQTGEFNAAAVNNTAAQQAQIDQAATAATFNGQLDMIKFKAALVQQYIQQGMSADQANYQAQLQQQQYAAGIMAQQIAAAHGIGIQSAAQGAQLAGSLASAGGTALASALAPSSAATGAAAAAKTAETVGEVLI